MLNPAEMRGSADVSRPGVRTKDFPTRRTGLNAAQIAPKTRRLGRQVSSLSGKGGTLPFSPWDVAGPRHQDLFLAVEAADNDLIATLALVAPPSGVSCEYVGVLC